MNKPTTYRCNKDYFITTCDDGVFTTIKPFTEGTSYPLAQECEAEDHPHTLILINNFDNASLINGDLLQHFTKNED